MPFVFRWNGLGLSQKREDTTRTPSSGPHPNGPPPAQGRRVSRYHEIFDCLDEHGMVPFVTLHHFVHPGWFHDRGPALWPLGGVEVCRVFAGGFERGENIPLFVGFCIKAFKTFGHRAVYWATFNEPTIYTYFSYTAGLHAPGATYQQASTQHSYRSQRCVSGRYRLTGKVLMHLLQAHCIVCQEPSIHDVCDSTGDAVGLQGNEEAGSWEGEPDRHRPRLRLDPAGGSVHDRYRRKVTPISPAVIALTIDAGMLRSG